MDFLLKPLPGFKKLVQRPRLGDAALVVVSVVIVFLGYRIAQLAAGNLLTAANFVRAVFDVVIGAGLGWIAIAGAAVLLSEAVGGEVPRKRGLETALVLTGLSAVPIVFAGIVAMLVALVLNAFWPSCGWQHWIVLAIMWLGVALGVPGLYFSLALEAGYKMRRAAAVGITLILLAATIAVVTLQYYVLA